MDSFDGVNRCPDIIDRDCQSIMDVPHKIQGCPQPVSLTTGTPQLIASSSGTGPPSTRAVTRYALATLSNLGILELGRKGK